MNKSQVGSGIRRAIVVKVTLAAQVVVKAIDEEQNCDLQRENETAQKGGKFHTEQKFRKQNQTELKYFHT